MYHRGEGKPKMLNTHVRAVRDLRNNYAELADIVKKEDHVIITNNGKSESVLISFESFKKYEEFLHFRYIDMKLEEAEEQSKESNVKYDSHENVFTRLKEKYGI
jgi:prevent-host-death family protein